MVLAWFVVYSGRLLVCLRARRLWKARNYKYNMLLASLVAAAIYVASIQAAIGMSFNSGPKLNSTIIATCVFGLICLEVFDEHKARRQRLRQQRKLRELQGVEGASCSPEDSAQHLSGSTVTHGTGGLV